MKRLLTLILVLTTCLGLVACGSNDEAETQNPLEGVSFYEMDSWGTIRFEVPDDWTVSGDLNSPTFTAPHSGIEDVILLQFSKSASTVDLENDAEFDKLFATITDGDSVAEATDPQRIQLAGCPGGRLSYVMTEATDLEYGSYVFKVDGVMLGSEGYVYTFLFLTPDEHYDLHVPLIDYILDSIVVPGAQEASSSADGEAEPERDTSATSGDEQSAKGDSVTTGQKNALSSAHNYLSIMAFSHSGLVAQLEYEGYTNEEAVYAADNCGADWNEQAAKSAEAYLDLMSFSRSELIEQLEYDGYTNAQAIYGVEANGY